MYKNKVDEREGGMAKNKCSQNTLLLMLIFYLFKRLINKGVFFHTTKIYFDLFLYILLVCTIIFVHSRKNAS